MAVGPKVEPDPEMKERLGIFGLGLHEALQVNSAVIVLRVPGGWLYGFNSGDGPQSTTFVPYSRNVDEDTAKKEQDEAHLRESAIRRQR